jgi:hypothetical protein
MTDILSGNTKKEYPQSDKELIRLEGKRFVQGVSYFINKIHMLLKKFRNKYVKKEKK